MNHNVLAPTIEIYVPREYTSSLVKGCNKVGLPRPKRSLSCISTFWTQTCIQSKLPISIEGEGNYYHNAPNVDIFNGLLHQETNSVYHNLPRSKHIVNLLVIMQKLLATQASAGV